MSEIYDNVRDTIHRSADFRNLQRKLDDLPGQVRNYVRDNFTTGEGLQLGADIAGIFDPSPFSDIAGGIIAAARGDWLSLGTSALGIIPYIGDTGKLGKWAKLALTDRRYKYISDAVTNLNKWRRQMSVLTQTKALKASRRQLWEYYQKAKNGTCATEPCRRLAREAAEKLGRALPATGRWSPPGSKGNGTWFPDASTNLTAAQKAQINNAGGIRFTEGNPDFSSMARELPPPGSGMTTLPMQMTTNNGRDVRKAFSGYFDMASANGQTFNRAQRRALQNDYTFHHTPDGMQMVPKWLNSGVSHSGPPSYMRWSKY